MVGKPFEKDRPTLWKTAYLNGIGASRLVYRARSSKNHA